MGVRGKVESMILNVEFYYEISATLPNETACHRQKGIENMATEDKPVGLD